MGFEPKSGKASAGASGQAAAQHQGLSTATAASSQHSASAAPGDAVDGCPLDKPVLQAIACTLLDEADQPVPDVELTLKNPGGQVVLAQTGREGTVQFKGLPAGNYQLGICGLDKAAWKLEGSESFPETGGTEPRWQPEKQLPNEPQSHTVAEQDCMASIASVFGFHRETLWQHAGNKALQDAKAEPLVLLPGQKVEIPARELHWQAVEAGQRVKLRRLGVPETFALTLLDREKKPRADLPFLATVLAADGSRLKREQGSSDGDGRLEVKIPPHAHKLELTLGRGPQEVKKTFLLGRLEPVSSDRGVQSRLSHLGYLCGKPDGKLGPLTEKALRAFQKDNGLDVSGKPDEATRAKLKELHRS